MQKRAPADRGALLAEADPEVRREVEAILAQDASGGKILDGPVKDQFLGSENIVRNLQMMMKMVYERTHVKPTQNQ